MSFSLTFLPKYWFDDQIQFDSQGRQGVGSIATISISLDGLIDYMVSVDDGMYIDCVPSIFGNEIIPTQTQEGRTYTLTIHPHFQFGQNVRFDSKTQNQKGIGRIYAITVEKDLQLLYEIHRENTNRHQPGILAKEIFAEPESGNS